MFSVIERLVMVMGCGLAFSLADAGSRCQKRLVHVHSLKELDSIWSEAEAGKNSLVHEKRNAVLGSGEELKSVYLRAVDSAEVRIKLRVQAIQDEVAKRGIASFGGVDALIVGAGAQTSNFVGGAVDALRTVRKDESGKLVITGGRFSISQTTRFPRILVASPDGVAPALRLSPSATQVPVIWRRG
ncbi:MAG: hypothetical protein IPK68_19800 [Bdellovibrionales bacterium]|nr:hypothetical protein [Bdellovibrionales bacterium]